MDKEAASCPAMGADQSPDDDMPDGRTNEEVGEQRKANIRRRIALEKEEKETEMEVRSKERNIAHGTRDMEVALSRRQLQCHRAKWRGVLPPRWRGGGDGEAQVKRPARRQKTD